MAGSFKDTDRGYKQLMGRLKKAQPTVKVGVFGDQALAVHAGGGEVLTVGEIAEVHEFGRGNVPERSWLRGYVDANGARISKMLARVAEEVAAGRLTAEQGLDLVGLKIVGEIKQRLPHLEPPLEESTIKAKGSSATLVDKGQFRSSIAHAVVPAGGET